MAMKPRGPEGVGIVLVCLVAILFALDGESIAQYPGFSNKIFPPVPF